MKKILLLAAMAAAFSAGAQNFKVYSGDVELKDGETLNMSQMYEHDFNDLIFDPQLTLVTTKAGNVTLTLDFTKSETAPALSGEDDYLNYLNGIGDPILQICSENIAKNCIRLTLGQKESWTGTLAADYTEDLKIEQSYTLGSAVEGIEGLTISSQFDLTIEQGGESITVTCVIELDAASISSISADKVNNSGARYDLQGRKLAQPAKGVNIVNGQKVLVK